MACCKPLVFYIFEPVSEGEAAAAAAFRGPELSDFDYNSASLHDRDSDLISLCLNT